VLGILDQRYDQVDDLVRARRVPSPQLVGTPERASLDLNALRARGVEIVGRLVGVNGHRAQFSGSLRCQCQMADLKQARLLGAIDELIEARGLPERALPGERPAATQLGDAPRLSLDLKAENVATVLWATGTRPDYSFLQVPAVDARGRLRHEGGIVVDAPGMVALGLPFMRRRKSSFIHGAEDDVRDLADYLVAHLRYRGGRRLQSTWGESRRNQNTSLET
jgi:putative flavoprotein involved in K+ transport